MPHGPLPAAISNDLATAFLFISGNLQISRFLGVRPLSLADSEKNCLFPFQFRLPNAIDPKEGDFTPVQHGVCAYLFELALERLIAHVGRLLHALGFSPQQPLRRARERDEEAIERWRREDWPRIKKRDAASKPASCFSMKPAFFCSR